MTYPFTAFLSAVASLSIWRAAHTLEVTPWALLAFLFLGMSIGVLFAMEFSK